MGKSHFPTPRSGSVVVLRTRNGSRYRGKHPRIAPESCSSSVARFDLAESIGWLAPLRLQRYCFTDVLARRNGIPIDIQLIEVWMCHFGSTAFDDELSRGLCITVDLSRRRAAGRPTRCPGSSPGKLSRMRRRTGRVATTIRAGIEPARSNAASAIRRCVWEQHQPPHGNVRTSQHELTRKSPQ